MKFFIAFQFEGNFLWGLTPSNPFLPAVSVRPVFYPPVYMIQVFEMVQNGTDQNPNASTFVQCAQQKSAFLLQFTQRFFLLKYLTSLQQSDKITITEAQKPYFMKMEVIYYERL